MTVTPRLHLPHYQFYMLQQLIKEKEPVQILIGSLIIITALFINIQEEMINILLQEYNYLVKEQDLINGNWEVLHYCVVKND